MNITSNSIRNIFQKLFKVGYFFTTQNSPIVTSYNNRSACTISRYKNGITNPSYDDALIALCDMGIDPRLMADMIMEDIPDQAKILKRIDPNGKTGSNPGILVVSTTMGKKTKWVLRNGRVLLWLSNMEVENGSERLKLWRLADYVLLYNKEDCRVCRLFQIDKYGKGSSVRLAKELKKDCYRTFALTHKYYFEVHLRPNKWVDICDLDMKAIMQINQIDPDTPKHLYLSDFFKKGVDTSDEQTTMHQAADKSKLGE